jgi:signal transduction histidine kinase
VTEVADAAHADARFRLAVQAAGTLVYEWHVAEGRVEWFGDVDSALGLPPGGLPRTLAGWEAVVHPDDRAAVVAVIGTAAATRQPFTLSYRVRRADGTIRWWREHGLVLDGTSPHATVFVGACTDVSAQRAHDNARYEAQRLDAITRLAGGMAHDVNNMLSVIQGYSELLRDELTARPSGLALLDEVLEAVARTGLLTRQLLAYAGRLPLKPRPVSLAAVLHTMRPSLERLVGDGVTLDLQVTDPSVQVVVDPAHLEQALGYLAVNAREAMPDGGLLRLRLARDVADDRLILELSDAGRGMTPEVQAQAFDPFFTTKAERRGAGLGLSAAYGIVAQSGGTLTVQHSAPGRGTTVRLTFPQHHGDDAATRSASADGAATVATAVEGAAMVGTAPDGATGHATPPERPIATPQLAAAPESTPGVLRPLVLVVEDDAVFALLTRRLLTHLGYDVLLAGSVQEAIQQVGASSRAVDVVLTDMIMAGGSGRDLASHLAISHPGLPVLFMSGYSAEHLVRTGTGMPQPYVLLQKPFSQEELGRAVAAALASRAG